MGNRLRTVVGLAVLVAVLGLVDGAADEAGAASPAGSQAGAEVQTRCVVDDVVDQVQVSTRQMRRCIDDFVETVLGACSAADTSTVPATMTVTERRLVAPEIPVEVEADCASPTAVRQATLDRIGVTNYHCQLPGLFDGPTVSFPA